MELTGTDRSHEDVNWCGISFNNFLYRICKIQTFTDFVIVFNFKFKLILLGHLWPLRAIVGRLVWLRRCPVNGWLPVELSGQGLPGSGTV